MIIVRLTGGLGNQLFQYAAGFRLAQVNQAQLKLDLSSYKVNPERAYALTPFRIQGLIASRQEVNLFGGRERIRNLKLWLHRKRLYLTDWHWLRQTSPRIMPEVLAARGKIYLDGVWQNQKYFEDVMPALQAELAFRDPPTGLNEVLAEKIRAVNAVSMHIRRGDYVNNPRTQSIHGVCTLDYYQKALDNLAQTMPDIHLFIFSDDPVWAKANLAYPFPTTVVDHNPPEEAHEDLRLMSLCRHHIIANSSFSWWGAWLNPYPQKQVYAPSRWFNTTNYSISDIVPPTWHLIEV